MAELVGVYAASHGPMIVRNWTVLPSRWKDSLTSAFTELGRRIRAARPDALIVISPDHWVNFFIDNLPGICVGVGETHAGPPEPWLKEFPHRVIAGHAKLASHIVETAYGRDFEPSVSYRLALDHGFCIPLWKAGLDPLPAIVPVVLNDLEPPQPSVKRCYAWGTVLAEAVASYPGDLRVAILATGGLSHSIGEPTMGEIDEAFDRDCIRHFESGDRKALLDYLDRRLPVTGNGAAEVRNWVAAHGAARGRGFELISYSAIPEVYVGCGFASWNLGAATGGPTRRPDGTSRDRT
ncbi:MAG: 2,3-dihydroxyphenylpropionate 1,2-dioxygenase [Betaproteobacteria bacterium]|nr:2,3-dihydroxyphenylpropionate 1,2-dioxygenase [Betaproteobacteria bacterium]